MRKEYDVINKPHITGDWLLPLFRVSYCLQRCICLFHCSINISVCVNVYSWAVLFPSYIWGQVNVHNQKCQNNHVQSIKLTHDLKHGIW